MLDPNFKPNKTVLFGWKSTHVFINLLNCKHQKKLNTIKVEIHTLTEKTKP